MPKTEYEPEIDDLIKIREESSMPKWIVITEVESEIDPAMFNYVNGTTLISSQLKEESMDKVWGEREGLCAWCNDKAQTKYVGEMTNGEVAEYQVCHPCDKERN